jgi:galactofuranosylgalactofuranosylrhamnosyl-N-acetylglucosaminyl-diphospho-decaprenol beta-1,5/1,6-galactofuranosyltransferase
LADGSAAVAAEIRRIRAAYPETAMRPFASIEGDFREMQVVRAPNAPGHEVLTWLKRAAYHLIDRAPHETGMVVAGEAHWWHVSTFRRAVVTDMSEQGLRVRTRDRARALALARRGARSLRRLVTEGPAVAAQYRAEMGSLTSRENWERLYGLDERSTPPA